MMLVFLLHYLFICMIYSIIFTLFLSDSSIRPAEVAGTSNPRWGGFFAGDQRVRIVLITSPTTQIKSYLRRVPTFHVASSRLLALLLLK